MDLDLFSLAKQLFEAVMSGNWALVVAAALVAVVFALRKLPVPFFQSDAGGVVLAFVGALSGGMANAFAAGANFTWALFLKTAQVAFVAMGGYVGLKKLLWPLATRALEWLKSKMPAGAV
jgi:hypothetical protein